jgi:hypothetical protein
MGILPRAFPQPVPARALNETEYLAATGIVSDLLEITSLFNETIENLLPVLEGDVGNVASVLGFEIVVVHFRSLVTVVMGSHNADLGRREPSLICLFPARCE